MNKQTPPSPLAASLWYQNGMFYGVDVRRFQDSNGDGFGDFPGLISRLDYLRDLGIDGLWLLPFFDTPLRDNGYDVSDYYKIDYRVGTLDDFARLVEEAHQRGIRLVMDLVMNHTSDQHPWFQAARRDAQSRYFHYYGWEETPTNPNTGGGTIFPGEEDSVWTYDPLAKLHYFHRFYHFQPELNLSNPAVQEEVFRVIDFWLAMGVDGFRIDAAPIMLEPTGEQNRWLQDPHTLFQEIHRYTMQRNLEAVLLGEANLEMEKMGEFFGGGSELNMLFNFLLGPYILLSIAEGQAGPLETYLRELLDPPENDQWLNFLRNLDELSLEMMPEEQKQEVFKHYAPDENMRIYGRGIRRRIAPMLAHEGGGMDRAKMELAYSLLYSTPGAAILMYGDEIGMGDDLSLPGRHPVRTPMQWTAEKNAGFSTAAELIAPVIADGPFSYAQVNVQQQIKDEGSFLNFVRRLIAVRKAHPEIGLCRVHVIETVERDPRVIAHHFEALEENEQFSHLAFAHNLSAGPLTVTLHLEGATAADPQVRLGRGKVVKAVGERVTLELPGHGYLWVQT